jgi:hypothetical protein
MHYPAGGRVALTVNGLPIGEGVMVDAAGRFSSLVVTGLNAAPGYYIVTATVTSPGTATQVRLTGTVTSLVPYRLVTTGVNAVVRQSPEGIVAQAFTVPPEVDPFTALPAVYLPAVQR